MRAARSRLYRLADRRGGRALILAGLASLFAVNVALAYSLFRSLPFTGSIFDPGRVVLSQAITNDDGIESEPDGFDAGDNGLDPIAAADLTYPYTPGLARDAGNIQNCTATVAGETVEIRIDRAYNGLRCAVKYRAQNLSTRAMLYEGATISGGPMILLQDEPEALCMNPGAQPFMHFELGPGPGAVAGETWTSTIDLEWTDLAACP